MATESVSAATRDQEHRIEVVIRTPAGARASVRGPPLGCRNWDVVGGLRVRSTRGRYCDASFIVLPRPLPGAAKTRRPDAVPLHPVACSAGPWRRRQGPGDPRSASPTQCAAPPDGSTQAGARRPSAARCHQSRVALILLVLLLRQAGDAAALAP